MVRQSPGFENAGVRIKFLWKSPNLQQYRIIGLPDGPSGLRRDLAAIFSGQASYVVRKSIAELMMECECTVTGENGLYKIAGVIRDPAESADRFETYVNPGGWSIDRVLMYMRTGEVVTTTYETKEVQGFRHIVKETSRIEKDGKATVSQVTYTYAPVENVIAVKTAVATVKHPDGRELSLTFDFSNYQVNLGLPDIMFEPKKEEKPAAG
jgi:hypothetical protein